MGAVVLCLMLAAQASFAQKRSLTLTDILKFRQLESPVISDDGLWVAYAAQPDRGDGEAKIHSLSSSRVYTISRGGKPVFSRDARWVALTLKPTAIDIEKKEKEKEKPKSGMVLLNTASGDTLQIARVESFLFSNDARWLAYLKSKPDKKPDPAKADAAKDTGTAVRPKLKKDLLGSDLVLRNLQTRLEVTIPFVTSFAFDSTSAYLAYVIADTTGFANGVYLRSLRREGMAARALVARPNGAFTNLLWSNDGGSLAFVTAIVDEKEKPGPGALWIWNGRDTSAQEIATAAITPAHWLLPSKNSLIWSRDGERLFFGLRPSITADRTQEEKKDSLIDVLDSSAILMKRELDVWGWNDPRIVTNQKKRWKDASEQTYRAIYHQSTGRVALLADTTMPVLEVSENPHVALGRSNVPYLKSITWEGEFNDLYLVNLVSGERKVIASRLAGAASLSPDGGSVVYFNDNQWYLYSTKGATTRNLTASLGVAFYDEEDDTPDPPNAYGFGGWVEGGKSFLLYDRYDVWQFNAADGAGINLTQGAGRKGELLFRVQRLDPDAQSFLPNETLLLTAYHDRKKFTALYSTTLGTGGATPLLEEKKRFSILAKAKNAGKILYTRQSYTEFPDVWVGDLSLRSTKRISDLNPQAAEFAWGSAELVDWISDDGTPLQGVLIKPGNYEQGKRYPVLVYFYELSSQRLYDFNQVVISHRPCFPYYASNGYALFLPDVRFEVGRPGFSATKCIVPGVQKLIAMGIAEPKAIALHGHSWSGYQTAFMITQTNLFACAIAGAPVANMTSAYSGIRQESGLARQFQYEEDQSRIGGSLWEYPERYVENSPVFFADKIRTPLLIEFGDEDEAVPWQQGIEMYLAMRRLEKPAWMLEYRGEPHHLKKYPNKLDYSIKFREFLDHYLKGTPAPDWMTRGIPYSE
jgi:dipeptidyl aminopeptidase/acylaminoacyl peptidase